MTLKTCLRCDWHGETREPACPNCGTRPLYVIGASPGGAGGSPVEHGPDERSGETRSVAPTPSSGNTAPSSDPSTSPAKASIRDGRSTRSTAVFVSGVFLLIAALGIWLNAGGGRSGQTATPGAEPSRSPTSEGSSDILHRPRTEAIGPPEDVGTGRQSLTVRRVPFSFRVPSAGWYRSGDLYVSKSTVGPQGADAIVFWTTVWRSKCAVACGQWWGSPVGSVADWAREASKQRGTELVAGPVAVTVGGYAAQHVVFTVRKDVACNPGFFHRWKVVEQGPFWSSTEVGDTVRIWLVKVGDTVLYIEGDTHEHAGAKVKREVDEIVASMVFD
jgi:hypothetical protein